MKVQEISKGVERVLENFDAHGYSLMTETDESPSQTTDTDLPIEATLQRLSKFVNHRIRYEDFTNADKKNMVELFVSHSTTMT